MVPDEWSWNATDIDGGGLYVGTEWPNSDSFTFTNLGVEEIKNGDITNPLIGFDTVVLWATRFNFGETWNNTVFSSRILNFVNNGGKLIIYTSEINSAISENKYAFSNFIYPFTIDSPGRTGSQDGTLTNLKNDTLSSTNPDDASYINLSAITSQTDAVGDLTVMTSYDSHWYIDLFGVNVNNIGGPAHAYAFYGAGLIIFNGIDVDDTTIPRNSKTTPIAKPSNDDGRGAIEMIWWRELSIQLLDAGQNVNGLTLDPATAINVVNTAHTVTATLRDTQTFEPISNTLINFNITSGPNFNSSGQALTNENGTATFSWTSTVAGTDTLTAAIPGSDSTIVSTATKTWVTPGPLSVSVTPGNWTMDVGQTKEFTATPNGGSFNYTSYQWYINGSALIDQTMPAFTFIPDTPGYYLLSATVTDNETTTSPRSDNATITVNPAPTISIDPAGPLTMNAGETQRFNATYNGGTEPISLQWYLNNVATDIISFNYTYTATGSPANVSCALTDNATIPVTVFSNTVLINPSSGGFDGDGSSDGGGGSTTIIYVEKERTDSYYIDLSIFAPQGTLEIDAVPTEVTAYTNGTELETWFNIKNGTSWVYPTNQTCTPPIILYDGSPDFFVLNTIETTENVNMTNDVLGTKIVINPDFEKQNYSSLSHSFGSLNLSNKTVFHLKIFGKDSGCNLNVDFLAPDTSNYYRCPIKDNFTGAKDFYIPVSSMKKAGNPSLSSISTLTVSPVNTTRIATLYIQSISMIDDLNLGFADGTYTLVVYASIKEGFRVSSSIIFSVLKPAPVYPYTIGWLELVIIGAMILILVGSIFAISRVWKKKRKTSITVQRGFSPNKLK
jgi:hypothetical protein